MISEKIKTLQQEKIFCYTKTGDKEFIYQQYKDIEDTKFFIIEYRVLDSLQDSLLIVNSKPFEKDFLSLDFIDEVVIREVAITSCGILFKAFAITEKGIIYSGGTIRTIIQSQAEDGYMYIGKLL